jgi:inhibitor of KinA sporulation pathway (predicted exonuclease)
MANLNHTRVLVLDLELQCWTGPPPEGFSNDIIQIGLVELDLTTLKQTREANLYIRPEKCLISPYCTELTGITPEIIKRLGRRFPDAVNTIVKEFGPTKKVTFTWGDDQSAIERACLEAEVNSPFHFVDLSWFYASLCGSKRNISVEGALQSFRQKFEGRPHNALDDAHNTGEVYLEIVRQQRLYKDSTELLQILQTP